MQIEVQQIPEYKMHLLQETMLLLREVILYQTIQEVQSVIATNKVEIRLCRLPEVIIPVPVEVRLLQQEALVLAIAG